MSRRFLNILILSAITTSLGRLFHTGTTLLVKYCYSMSSVCNVKPTVATITKVIEFGTNHTRVRNFLLVMNSNLGPILLQRYCRFSAENTDPTLRCSRWWPVGWLHVLRRKPTISLKRDKIGPRLLLGSTRLLLIGSCIVTFDWYQNQRPG